MATGLFYRSKSCKHIFNCYPYFFLLIFELLNILLIYASGLICFLGILIKIVAVYAHESYNFLHIREIQDNDITINCHLPDISSAASDAHLLHLLSYALLF